MNTKQINLNQFLLLLIGAMMISFTSCKEKEAVKSAEDAIENVVEETKEAVENVKEGVESLAEKAEKEMNEGRAFPVYNMTQVDTPPLFDASCKTEKNPQKCSEEKMLKFIAKNAKFPKRANSDAKSLEQVLVVIEKDGTLSNTKYIASGNQKACEGCQQAAADVVGMMKNWEPAMKDGKAVAVKMTIPIKFAG